MKGAKELARMLTGAADRYAEVCGLSLSQDTARTIAAHLDRLAAIDSAAPGDAKEIERLHANDDAGVNVSPEWVIKRDFAEARKHRATLLAIVQRQAGDLVQATEVVDERIAETEKWHAKWKRAMAERVADQAEIERLRNVAEAARAEVERLKLEVAALKAERNHLATTRMESSAEVDRLQTERTALAQENARLINEVGAQDATARELRHRAEVLARGIVAYRTGSFTLAQVWENEEGKAVPR